MNNKSDLFMGSHTEDYLHLIIKHADNLCSLSNEDNPQYAQENILRHYAE